MNCATPSVPPHAEAQRVQSFTVPSWKPDLPNAGEDEPLRTPTSKHAPFRCASARSVLTARRPTVWGRGRTFRFRGMVWSQQVATLPQVGSR